MKAWAGKSMLLATLIAGVTPAVGQELTVVSVEPIPRAVTVPVDSAIVVHFDRPVRPETIVPWQSFWAFGRWSGTVAGTFSYSNGDQTVTLTPAQPFSAGESVMVILSHDIEATDGSSLRPGGYSYQFWTRARRNQMELAEFDRLSTRTIPEQPSRAYGGIATDLNGDRFVDLTIVNEDTADLRVFLNKADGSGSFHEFLTPTFPVGPRASPSEPADFNRDGAADICVANINEDTVSILLGNGDGTFGPEQTIGVGDQPRGIAVLDFDGDGDVDVANTNYGSDNVTLLLNDGTGSFGALPPIDAGIVDEWALASADMDGDGILDLIVGSRSASASLQRIAVLTGNGDGTFSLASTQDAGGPVWMLGCGDVDGNGTEDVATANGFGDTGSILLGDGTGNLSPPQVYAADPLVLATDLGDLDGDGDLDWVTSSFDDGIDGEWYLFVNQGDGTFQFDTAFPATRAASCALMMDLDNDGDLDMAMIDELADEVLLMKNSGTVFVPTVSFYGTLSMTLCLLASGTIKIRSLLKSSGTRQVSRMESFDLRSSRF